MIHENVEISCDEKCASRRVVVFKQIGEISKERGLCGLGLPIEGLNGRGRTIVGSVGDG